MFELALTAAMARLERARQEEVLARFALIGGFAVSRWSTPRATADIDFIISLGSSSLEALSAHLGGEARKGDIQDPLLGSVQFFERDELGQIPVQLLQLPPAWEEVAFVDVVTERIFDISLPIADWKALLLLKLYAGGPLDLEDARNLLVMQQPSVGAMKYLRTKANYLRVSRRLEKVLRAAEA